MLPAHAPRLDTSPSSRQLDARTLGVLNDNNYPFSAGRTPGQPDNNEFILIRLDAPLPLAEHGRPHDHDDRDDEDHHGGRGK